MLLDCGPGVLARLREHGWPEVGAIVITHFHLDHWGDLVPWVWGSLYLQGRGGEPASPLLWVPPGGRSQTRGVRLPARLPGDVRAGLLGRRVHRRASRSWPRGWRSSRSRVPHYELDAYALRVSDGERTLAYSGDSAPSPALVEIARDADLFLCEATLLSGDVDGMPRGHLSLEEAEAAFVASGAKKLLVTHRPAELPAPAAHDLAYDGLARPI